MLISAVNGIQVAHQTSSNGSTLEPTQKETQVDDTTPEAGVTVTLSSEGKAKASEDKNADIDASKLPDGIKKILKAIRDLQEKIEKKLEELDRVRNDQSLSDEARKGKVQGIVAELGVLNSQLSSTSNDLHRTENEMRLSSTQKKLASLLSAPRN